MGKNWKINLFQATNIETERRKQTEKTICINILLFYLFYISDLSHGGYQDHQNSNKYNGIVTQNPLKSLVNTKRSEPYFDPNVPKNITALVGKSAYLNCIVKNLGNKTVEYNFPINRKNIFTSYLISFHWERS